MIANGDIDAGSNYVMGLETTTAGEEVRQNLADQSIGQVWCLEEVTSPPSEDGTPFYNIVNERNGFLADIFLYVQAEGANLNSWSFHGGTNQQFKLTAVGSVEPVSCHDGHKILLGGVFNLTCSSFVFSLPSSHPTRIPLTRCQLPGAVVLLILIRPFRISLSPDIVGNPFMYLPTAMMDQLFPSLINRPVVIEY